MIMFFRFLQVFQSHTYLFISSRILAMIWSRKMSFFSSRYFCFIFIPLIEKYVYQHSSDDLVDGRLETINQFTSVFYHVVLGIVIFDFSEQNLFKVLLLFVPIVIFTAVRTLPVRHHSSGFVRFFVSLSTLAGVFLAWLLYDAIQGIVQLTLVGFVIGGLLFSVIRHSIPHGKEGKPLYFISGVALYTPIILYAFIV